MVLKGKKSDEENVKLYENEIRKIIRDHDTSHMTVMLAMSAAISLFKAFFQEEKHVKEFVNKIPEENGQKGVFCIACHFNTLFNDAAAKYQDE